MSIILDQTILTLNTVHIAERNATVKLNTGFNTYYKMQGYNPSTGQYETWHSMNEPLMTPLSGHSLTNVEVIASWIDR